LLEVSVASGGPIALDRAVVTVTYSFCGNRAAEPGEQCDDGDSDWCDGCTPQCLLLDPACDDANPVTQDSCQTATGCAHAAPPIPALPYWR
jgi:cysteine-rich repeat protein